jgi:BirA family biotin operon repressor/biotin-[acetyl-CoA-carboxylase] ligase
LQTPSQNSVIGASFYELQSVESTNNYALNRVHEGMAYHGDCFFAHEQTKGKGQRGKGWDTEKSSNIILSIVLKPEFLKTYQQFHLSACLAVAVESFLRELAGDETRIKWPNDVYWRDGKVGGILIENIIGGSVGNLELGIGNLGVAAWEWAVVGIGININQENFSTHLPNPVSLKQITGKNYNVIELAKSLCNYVNDNYYQLKNDSFVNMLQRYNDRLYKKNETVKLKKESKMFQALIKGVDENGALIIEHGIEERFQFGEVEWIK